MVSNEFWVNLPVKNVQRSVEFYKGIGFSLRDDIYSSGKEAHFQIDRTNGVLNIFDESTFNGIIEESARNPLRSSEVLFTIDVDTAADVEEYKQNVVRTGAPIVREQIDAEHTLFGFTFQDPDGHFWSLLYRKDRGPAIRSYFDGKDIHGHGKLG